MIVTALTVWTRRLSRAFLRATWWAGLSLPLFSFLTINSVNIRNNSLTIRRGWEMIPGRQIHAIPVKFDVDRNLIAILAGIGGGWRRVHGPVHGTAWLCMTTIQLINIFIWFQLDLIPEVVLMSGNSVDSDMTHSLRWLPATETQKSAIRFDCLLHLQLLFHSNEEGGRGCGVLRSINWKSFRQRTSVGLHRPSSRTCGSHTCFYRVTNDVMIRAASFTVFIED